MNKPDNISVKDYLIKLTAEELHRDLDVVDRIVNNQFKQANKASRRVNEIEISGFGKFLQSQNKIAKRVKRFINIRNGTERLLKEASTQEDVIRFTKRLESATNDLAFYTSKLKPKDDEDKVEGISGRVEEQSNTPSEA